MAIKFRVQCFKSRLEALIFYSEHQHTSSPPSSSLACFKVVFVATFLGSVINCEVGRVFLIAHRSTVWTKNYVWYVWYPWAPFCWHAGKFPLFYLGESRIQYYNIKICRNIWAIRWSLRHMHTRQHVVMNIWFVSDGIINIEIAFSLHVSHSRLQSLLFWATSNSVF